VLGRTAHSYLAEARYEEVLRIEEDRRPVLEQLAYGPFAEDTDLRVLANSYARGGEALRFLGQTTEAIQSKERALAICQRLADANPMVIDYKGQVANALKSLGQIYLDRGDYANGRRYALQALNLGGEVEQCETKLALCDLGMGRHDA